MRHRHCLPACVLAVTAALTLTAAPIRAHEPAPAAAPADTAAAHGLRAVRDKVTGKLRAPTADELETMQAEERTRRQARGESAVQSAPLRVLQHANGMRSAVLGPDYLVTLKGERRADGSVRRFHPNEPDAHAFRDHRPTE